MQDLDKTPRAGGTTEPPSERLERERLAAGEALGKAKAEAGKIGSEVGGEAAAMADDVRDRASESLSHLATSVRRASDEFGKSQPGLLADLMGQAADGVESFARSVGDQKPSAMLGTARDFGRRNPLGLLLGGAAVGFALSRLATSASSSGDDTSGRTRPDHAQGTRGSEGGNRHGV